MGDLGGVRTEAHGPEGATRNAGRVWRSVVAGVLLAPTVFLVLGALAAVILVPASLARFVRSIEQNASINVFLADDAAQADVDALQQQLLDNPQVSGVEYTTKEEALEKFKKTVDPEMRDDLQGNPLPASLDVELKDPRAVPEVAKQIANSPQFLAVAEDPNDPEGSLKHGQQIIGKLFSFVRITRLLGVVVAAVGLGFGVVAVLLLLVPPHPRGAWLGFFVGTAVGLFLFVVTAMIAFVVIQGALTTVQQEAPFLQL